VTPCAASLFAWRAGMVFTARSLELWADPMQAHARLAAHMREKQQAFLAATRAAGQAGMAGASLQAIAAAAFRPVHRRVSANARALRRKG